MDHDEVSVEILLGFLNRYQDAVQTRGRMDLSPRDKEALGALAKGVAGDEIKSELIALLAQNELAMEYLADLLR